MSGFCFCSAKGVDKVQGWSIVTKFMWLEKRNNLMRESEGQQVTRYLRVYSQQLESRSVYKWRSLSKARNIGLSAKLMIQESSRGNYDDDVYKRFQLTNPLIALLVVIAIRKTNKLTSSKTKSGGG